ncbi:mechanosensitive ion channel domain-containing protein [Roseofilum capinflatum]|uniref:Mechanosensitive ion channel n=1 Tax=Roseofilum capinflatum BLCC-M114 TaxID=3022440 RepID=A0ABT7B3G6_9CYAN|nr:mechanosensitive ion channel domain-containing protein [Roseofilum capinflatum]MDJ1173679.1 mechanosensitive ion channel [Roseofilum capinflatum BLCC-M114]
MIKLRWRWILVTLLVCLLTLVAHPSWGRSPFSPIENRATVEMDGKVLFEVRGIVGFPAPERAEVINTKLEQVLQSHLRPGSPLPQYSIDPDNEQSILSFDNSYLLTVTPVDVRGERTTESQARRYAALILSGIETAQYERTAEYLRQAVLVMLGVLFVALGLHIGVNKGVQWGERRLRIWMDSGRWQFGRLQIPDKLLHRLIKLVRFGMLFGLWWAVGYYVTDLFPLLRRSRYWFFDLILESLTDPVFTLNENSYSLLDLLTLIGLTVGLWFGVRSLTRLFRIRVLAFTSTDRAVQDVLGVLVQSLLMFLGLLIILQIWGLDVSSLTIIASVLGVGIGFGLQNIANNLISGLIITFERHVQAGDFVEVANLMGTVEQVGARSTQILTLDQISIIVPNSRFLETEVINWSHSNPVSRLRLPVGVSYNCNPEQVRSVLLNTAQSHPDVMVEPVPQVLFKGFGDSSLDFELLVWIREPRQQFQLKSDLYFRLEKALRYYNLEIPYPQRDLHLRSTHIDEMLQQLQKGTEAKPEPQNSPPLELTDTALEDLIENMQGEEGVEIKDRWYRGNFYPGVFVAAEAVDWWMKALKLKQPQAVQLGQLLCDRQIIHHVFQDIPFQDSYEFYRFD